MELMKCKCCGAPINRSKLICEFRKSTLTKEDILEIKHVKFNDADKQTGNFFDPDAINHISNESIDACIDAINTKIIDKIRDDFDMCMICDMAIAYLEEHKKEDEKTMTISGSHTVCLEGCDDKTKFVMEMTDEEFEFLKKVVIKANNTSTYGCMPRLILDGVEFRKEEVEYGNNNQ